MFYVKLALMCLWCLVATLFWLPLFFLPGAFARWIRLMAWGILRVAGLRVEMEGEENLRAVRPCVFVGNHQSALDMATFGAFLPDDAFGIGKKEIAWIPVVGWCFALTGGFLINRSRPERARRTLDAVAKRLRERRQGVGIMPEGTRNLEGRGLLPFKKGAFHLAVAAQADLVVVVCAPLADRANFARRTLAPGLIRLKALPPISVQGKTEADVDELAERCRREMAEALASLDQSSEAASR